MEKSSRNKFLFLGGCVLVGAVAVYVLFFMRAFVRYPFRLPYIWDLDANRTLHGYIHTQPSRHVYLLAGPAQTGKSAAIRNLTILYRSRGHMVFNFDFTDANRSEDVFGFAKLGIFEGGKGAVKFPEVSIENAHWILQFFEQLEELANSTNLPIVFIQGVHKLTEFAPNWVDVGLGLFSRRDQYEFSVPVILETRDSTFRLKNLPECIRVLEFDEMADAYGNLVSGLHAYSSQEFKKMRNLVGLNGGALDSVFERLRLNMEIDDAVAEELNHTEKQVRRFRNDGMDRVITRICDAKERPISVKAEEIDSVWSLVHEGFLYLTDDLTLKTMNHAVWKALCN